jgi:hypothetical protein
MYQKTLNKWVKSDNIFVEKKYFYIEWFGKIPKKIDIINDEQPSDVIIYKSVKVKGLNTVVFCGKINSSNEKLKLPINTNEKLLPILKSNLQKCIRRNYTDLAIQTCIHMWNISPIEVLRRLPIIMVEDVCFMDSFIILIWMMGAIEKWNPTIVHLNWILGIVKQLSIYPIKTYVPDYVSNKNIPLYIENTILKEPNKYFFYKKHLYSLIIRENYGGMKCDGKMLLSCLWEIFLNKDLIIYNKIKPVKIKFYPLVLNDILLESVDFHCCNQLINFLINKYTNLSSNQLKNAIWDNRSSINYRDVNPVINKSTLNIWNIIKNDVDDFCQKYLEKNFKNNRILKIK